MVEGRYELFPCHHLIREGHLQFDANGSFVTVSRRHLVDLLRPYLAAVKFDLDFYRSANPDLAQAEAAGTVRNLHDHYIEFGYFEDRLPCLIEVDATFYAKEYPDVASGIMSRAVKSAQWHFETFGFKEGRRPSRGWTFDRLVQRR
jgi:hypothetical protein